MVERIRYPTTLKSDSSQGFYPIRFLDVRSHGEAHAILSPRHSRLWERYQRPPRSISLQPYPASPRASTAMFSGTYRRPKIEKPLQGANLTTAFLGLQTRYLRGAKPVKLHDFNPAKRFRQRAEHRRGTRSVNERTCQSKSAPCIVSIGHSFKLSCPILDKGGIFRKKRLPGTSEEAPSKTPGSLFPFTRSSDENRIPSPETQTSQNSKSSQATPS